MVRNERGRGDRNVPRPRPIERMIFSCWVTWAKFNISVALSVALPSITNPNDKLAHQIAWQQGEEVSTLLPLPQWRYRDDRGDSLIPRILHRSHWQEPRHPDRVLEMRKKATRQQRKKSYRHHVGQFHVAAPRPKILGVAALLPLGSSQRCGGIEGCSEWQCWHPDWHGWDLDHTENHLSINSRRRGRGGDLQCMARHQCLALGGSDQGHSSLPISDPAKWDKDRAVKLESDLMNDTQGGSSGEFGPVSGTRRPF